MKKMNDKTDTLCHVHHLCIICVCLMALCACEKADYQTFLGSYTYKTSGQVELYPTKLISPEDSSLLADLSAKAGVEPVWVSLSPETGQMNVVCQDADSATLLLTFNALMGDVCTMKASVKGDSLFVNGSPCKTMQLTDGIVTTGSTVVTVSGQGRLMDDMLVLDLVYNGSLENMTITGSRIQCVAKKN